MKVSQIIKTSQKKCNKLLKVFKKFNAKHNKILNNCHSSLAEEKDVFQQCYKIIKDIKINHFQFIKYNYLNDNNVFEMNYVVDFDIREHSVLDEKKSINVINDIQPISIRLSIDKKKGGFEPTILFLNKLHNETIKKNYGLQENNQ